MREALPHLSALDQVARIDRFVDDDGPGRGTRRLRLVNGSGLELELHPDRGLDIGHATVAGMPLAWSSSTGPVTPAAYEPDGSGWLRSFSGGLLATCGLDAFGPGGDDEDGAVGLHGRIGSTPARLLRTDVTSSGLVVEAVVRQAEALGQNLLLRRRIDVPFGRTEVHLRDTIVNEGRATSPHMVLYHLNLGWPLVEEGARIEIHSGQVAPRDEQSAAGTERRHLVDAPRPGLGEEVFVHSQPGGARASIVNAARGLRFAVAASPSLGHLMQWKQLAERDYVVGLEPANCPVITGRADARAAGVLPFLAPGQSVEHRLTLTISRGNDGW